MIVTWIYFDEFCILIIQMISARKKADFQMSNSSLFSWTIYDRNFVNIFCPFSVDFYNRKEKTKACLRKKNVIKTIVGPIRACGLVFFLPHLKRPDSDLLKNCLVKKSQFLDSFFQMFPYKFTKYLISCIHIKT